MSWLFETGGQNIGTSASVLPVNIQGLFPLGFISLTLFLLRNKYLINRPLQLDLHKDFGQGNDRKNGVNLSYIEPLKYLTKCCSFSPFFCLTYSEAPVAVCKGLEHEGVN